MFWAKFDPGRRWSERPASFFPGGRKSQTVLPFVDAAPGGDGAGGEEEQLRPDWSCRRRRGPTGRGNGWPRRPQIGKLLLHPAANHSIYRLKRPFARTSTLVNARGRHVSPNKPKSSLVVNTVQPTPIVSTDVRAPPGTDDSRANAFIFCTFDRDADFGRRQFRPVSTPIRHHAAFIAFQGTSPETGDAPAAISIILAVDRNRLQTRYRQIATCCGTRTNCNGIVGNRFVRAEQALIPRPWWRRHLNVTGSHEPTPG